MTDKEVDRYNQLKAKFRGDKDLLEFLALEIMYQVNEASISKENDDIKKTLGISDLRVKLSYQEDKDGIS